MQAIAMIWEDKIEFYEKQQSSWALVCDMCEVGATRVADAERQERIHKALQLAAQLEDEASAMLHRVRPDNGATSCSRELRR